MKKERESPFPRHPAVRTWDWRPIRVPIGGFPRIGAFRREGKNCSFIRSLLLPLPLFRIVSSNLFAASALSRRRILFFFFQIICLSALISRADKFPLSNQSLTHSCLDRALGVLFGALAVCTYDANFLTRSFDGRISDTPVPRCRPRRRRRPRAPRPRCRSWRRCRRAGRCPATRRRCSRGPTLPTLSSRALVFA